jgi:hypothetical protein
MIRLLILIVLLPSGAHGQDLEVEALHLEGIVFFIYEKDTSSESYYFIDNYLSTKRGKYTLIDNYSLANKTLNLCGDVNGMLRFAIAQRSESYDLTESSLFRSKAVFNSGQHFGGEIYEVIENENQLLISFKLSVFGIAINNECPALKHPLLAEENHCDFISDKNNTPVFLITNIIKISPLSQKDVKGNGLRKSSRESFYVVYCE